MYIFLLPTSLETFYCVEFDILLIFWRLILLQECLPYVYVCLSYACSAVDGQKRESNPLEQEWEKVVSLSCGCSGNAARHEHTEGGAGPEEEQTRKTGPEDLPNSQLNLSDHHGLYFPRVPTTMFNEVGFLKQRKFLLQFRRPEGQ